MPPQAAAKACQSLPQRRHERVPGDPLLLSGKHDILMPWIALCQEICEFCTECLGFLLGAAATGADPAFR